MKIRRPDSKPLPVVPEDASIAGLELAESLEVQPAEIQICKLKVKSGDLKFVKKLVRNGLG